MLKDGTKEGKYKKDLDLVNVESLTSSCLFLEDQEDKIDVTELRHFMHRSSLHRTNPPLFKRINDTAR